MLAEVDAGTFTPDLAGLAYFVDSSSKCFVSLLEILARASSLMLQLDEQSPETSLSRVLLESALDQLLSLSKLTHAHEHNHSFELDLPFNIGLLAHSLHDLKSSRVLAHDLEVLGVVEKGSGDLLHRHLHASSLDGKSGCFHRAL